MAGIVLACLILGLVISVQWTKDQEEAQARKAEEDAAWRALNAELPPEPDVSPSPVLVTQAPPAPAISMGFIAGLLFMFAFASLFLALNAESFTADTVIGQMFAGIRASKLWGFTLFFVLLGTIVGVGAAIKPAPNAQPTVSLTPLELRQAELEAELRRVKSQLQPK